MKCSWLSWNNLWTSWGNTNKTSMSDCVFFCPGAIWVTHWSDWTTTIKASGFHQFSPQGSAWAKTDVKNRAHVFVIKLWKWERTISPSTFGYRKQYENTWRIFTRFKMRGKEGTEFPHSCLLLRVPEDHSHGEHACACFVSIQQALVRSHTKQSNKYTNVALAIPNYTVLEYWLTAVARDLSLGVVCSWPFPWNTLLVLDPSSVKLAWDPSLRNLRLGAFAGKQSLGIDRLETFGLNMSLRNLNWRCSPMDFRMGSFVWGHSLGNFRFWTIGLDSSLRNFRLASFTFAAFAWDL